MLRWRHASPGDGTRPRGGAGRPWRLRHAARGAGAEADAAAGASPLRDRPGGTKSRSRFPRPSPSPTPLSRSSRHPRRISMPASGNSPWATSSAPGASSTPPSTCSCSRPTARAMTPAFASISSGCSIASAPTRWRRWPKATVSPRSGTSRRRSTRSSRSPPLRPPPPRRRPRRSSPPTSSARSTTCPSRRTSGCWPTSSCSRDACASGSRPASSGARSTSR